MNRPRVLIDACLLVKGNVSNVLFDLAQADLIHLHWTPEIGKEFVKNWTKTRLEKDGLGKHTDPAIYEHARVLKESKAIARLRKFELMQPEWLVPGWDFRTAELLRPYSEFCQGKRSRVHVDDYHVALAATVLATACPDDPVWLSTENIRHLPPVILESFRVRVVDQGMAIENILADHPVGFASSLEKTILDTRRPPITKADMLKILSSVNGFASRVASDAMKLKWSMPDVASVKKPSGSQASRDEK